MEAATVDKVETEVEGQADEPAAQTVTRLFKFSTWLHVGPGAEECEDREDGSCGDASHFHAWCRLPNQFQHREMRDKALAAKARRARQLRDPETDAYEILEQDLDELARRGDEAKPFVVDELLAPDWWKDYMEAQRDLGEREDEHGEKPFERIEHDTRRLEELERTPEDERPKDEYDELVRHVASYRDELAKRQEEIVNPRRDALLARDIGDLVDELRRARITQAANQEFMHVYSAHQWFVGTLRMPGGDPRFRTFEQMTESAPEVITALQAAFAELEQMSGAAGNS